MAIRMSKFLKQKLVYWRKTGSGPTGQPIYAAPVEVKCRWEDKQELLLLSDGRIVTSKAYAMTEYLLLLGSKVWYGTLAQWRASPAYPNPPTVAQGGYEIIMSSSTPDVKGNPLLFEIRM
jgi:hypothetical protein